MIKKTQSKVFMIVMLSLSIIIVGVISVIDIVNYNQSKHQSYTLVDNASRMIKQIVYPPLIPMESMEERDKQQSMLYWKTSQFYFVILRNDKIVKIINENDEKYSDEEIYKYALNINKSNKKNGSIGDLVYGIRNMKEGKIITFMDNSIANKSLRNMLMLSLLIGFLALVCAYIISKKISLWIVRPIEDAFNKQKQFISDASHELKTPLAVICANADILESEVGKSKWLNYIQNEVESMDKLVNNLLCLAKMEKENQNNETVVFNMSKTVLGATMVFESLAYEQGIELLDDIDDNLNIRGNSEEIKQLLFILIDNAIKHTKKNGQIIVSLKKNKNNIILKVKNMGDPIPKNEEEKIFERFYRRDESRNRDSKRYGLGLAIGKSIVEKHNGKIKVSWEDGFTIFTIIF